MIYTIDEIKDKVGPIAEKYGVTYEMLIGGQK